jgi:hypothetical protein
MRSIGYVTFALLGATVLTGGPAFANVCQVEKLVCATNMPVDGYCECTSHGMTEGGTVLSEGQARQLHQRLNATSGGCGSHPTAPGCRGQ